jgi:hypothetical protein
MPFIIQCPYPKCRKFNLLEDSARGTKVECLICKGPINVDASGSGEHPQEPPSPRESRQPTPSAQRQQIANCPTCGSLLRVPPAGKGKSIKCPRCQTVFAP